MTRPRILFIAALLVVAFSPLAAHTQNKPLLIQNVLIYDGTGAKPVVASVRIAGDRELIFGDVLVRVDPNFSLAMHIDTDEGNAAGIETGARGFIDGIQEENEGRSSHDLF